MRSALLVAFCLLAAPAASTADDAAPNDPAPKVTVMPFGDSLTKGTGSTHGAGYRLQFLHRMSDAGVTVDMLGSFHSGPNDIDRDHEGHQGQGVAKLDQVAFDEILKEKPDYVLLLIGTNDAKDSSLQPVAFRIRFSVLMDRILSESHIKLVVATIPPGRYGRRDKGAREAVNAIIEDEVDKRRDAGRSVRLIDVYHMLDPKTDFADTLHMNDGGYAKIGNAFADAVLDLMHSVPASASASTR